MFQTYLNLDIVTLFHLLAFLSIIECVASLDTPNVLTAEVMPLALTPTSSLSFCVKLLKYFEYCSSGSDVEEKVLVEAWKPMRVPCDVLSTCTALEKSRHIQRDNSVEHSKPSLRARKNGRPNAASPTSAQTLATLISVRTTSFVCNWLCMQRTCAWNRVESHLHSRTHPVALV